MATYLLEVVKKAEELFLEDVSFRKIAEQLGVKQHLTIYNWSRKYNWKKDRASYPANSLKEQLDQCSELVNKMRPSIDKVNILKPSKEDRELLLNYNRFSNLQLKLVRQLSGLKVVSGNSSKKNIFT